MALVVDRFEFLSREIFKVFSTCRDALALIGAVYAARHTLIATCKLLAAVKTHGLAKLGTQNLVDRYGPWAVVTGSGHGIGKAYAQELAAVGLNVIIVSLGEEDCQRTADLLVVTGCTGGIGEAFCCELATCGVNIVLVGRNVQRLQEVSSNLEKTFKVQTQIVAVDFNEGQPVYDKIRAAIEDKDIGILVNNVGVMYEYPQYFLDVQEDKLWQLINVNVAAATMMTHMVLPGMVERGKGAIITVASGASTMPTPQMTVYSATKAYLDYFIRALNYEYRGKGITIQCLMPFYVATRMTQYSTTLSSPSLMIPTASQYARSAVRTLGWSDRTTGYWPHTLSFWACSFIPEWLWMWAASRLNNALRRQAHQRVRRKSGTRSRHASGNAPKPQGFPHSKSSDLLAALSKQKLP